MKNILLTFVIFSFFTSFVMAQSTLVGKEARAQELNNMDSKLQVQLGGNSQGVLIRQVVIMGFVLKDARKLQKLLRSKKNKYFSQKDIDKFIDEIKTIYLQEGYGGLVEIKYTVLKHKLVFTVTLLNR